MPTGNTISCHSADKEDLSDRHVLLHTLAEAV
jgi:hypothetical protein